MALIRPRLDRRITIQKKVMAKDPDFGASKPTWTPVCRVWAERFDMLPSRPTEAMRSGVEVAAQRTRYRFRWRGDVDASMRIVEGDATYQIVGGPAEMGRREYLEVLGERYSTDGEAA